VRWSSRPRRPGVRNIADPAGQVNGSPRRSGLRRCLDPTLIPLLPGFPSKNTLACLPLRSPCLSGKISDIFPLPTPHFWKNLKPETAKAQIRITFGATVDSSRSKPIEMTDLDILARHHRRRKHPHCVASLRDVRRKIGNVWNDWLLPVSSCLMPKRIPQNLELSDGVLSLNVEPLNFELP
jgi:hypothetical protein